MDQHGQSRQPLDQANSEASLQHPHRQQSGSRQGLLEQTYGVVTPQYYPGQRLGDLRQQDPHSIGRPPASNERARPGDTQLYYAQGLPYEAGLPQHLQTSEQPQGPRGAQSAQTQQSSHYGTYVYGMQPMLQQQPHQAQYQHMHASQYSHSATSETVPTHFVAAPAAQFYPGIQQGTSALPSSAFAEQQAVPQYVHGAYTSAAPTPVLASTPGAMLQPSQHHGFVPQQSQQQHLFTLQRHQQQQLQQERQEFAPHQQIAQDVSTQVMSQYETVVRTIFTNISTKSLKDTPQLLTEITRFVAAHFMALGLAHDSESRNDESNLKVWTQFNRAWLTTLQCQFDIVQGVIDNHSNAGEADMLGRQALERLAEELIGLCDRVEKHGLVDYQMGIAEDEIIEHILRCTTQLDSLESAAERDQAGAGASNEVEPK